MIKLRLGVHYEPSNVDPHLGAAELALQMTNACLDTLVNKAPDGTYLPGLANHFDISEDQCHYRFHLRDDVRFHDDTPFDAAAMKLSLDRARAPENRSQLAGGLLGPVRDIRAPGSHTLEIELERPYALLLDALSQGWLAPMSPRAIAEMGAEIRRHPVGTGPFIFDRWDAGDRIVIRRNPDYAWPPALVENPGPACLTEIEFLFLPDEAARTAALRDGRVDAIFATRPTDCAALRADARFQVITQPIRGVPVCLMMNITRSPTDALAVRQAISHALDMDALVGQVFHGEFERAHGPVSHFTLGYTPDVEGIYPHDPARAAALLDAEGWHLCADGLRRRNGQVMEVAFYALPVNSYPEFGQIITQQLAQVGMRTIVELCPPPEWIAAGMQGLHHLIPQGKYASTSQFLGFVYHSRHSGPDGYGWSKRTQKDAPEIDQLIDAAETCIAPQDYVPMFAQAQRHIMQAALAVPIHCNTNLIACVRSLQGLRFDATGAYPLFHDTGFSSQTTGQIA